MKFCTCQEGMAPFKKKSEIQEEIDSLTVHGVSRVASAKNKYARIIWLMLCISVAVSFGIVAVKSFMKYYEYKTFIYRTVTQKRKLALPAITFCHTNFYHPSSFIIFDPPKYQKLPENCSFQEKKYFTNTMNLLMFQFACRMFIGKVNSKTAAMGTEIPQYIQFPTGFEITPNKEPCFTLNRQSTLVQQTAGENYGLHMIMYNQNLNASDNSPPKEFIIDRRNGIYATVHDPEQIVPMGGGILIPAGHHTHILVKKNVIKRLPQPYSSKCRKDWSNRDSIYPGKNTLQMCFSSCAYMQMYKMCSGVKPEMKVFMNEKEFPLKADIRNASFSKCQQKSLSHLDFQGCDCSEHCYEEIYTTAIDRNPWPQYWQAPSYVKLINDIEGKTNRTLSTIEIRERLLKVSIYYEDLEEHVSEEQPLYDLLTIVSDLGGQMGLFMGASLLSLAEIVALTVIYFKGRFARSDKAIELSHNQGSNMH